MKQFKFILVLGVLSLLMLSSCGGGGGSGSGTSANGSNNMGSVASVKLDSSNGGVANGAINVSLTPLIVLSFSTSVIPTTVSRNTISITTSPTNSTSLIKTISAKATTENGAVVIGTITANSDNTVFSFSPIAPLTVLTKYYVIVDGVQTLDGTSIPGVVFSFTTGDLIIPVAGIISPNNSATNVSTSPGIQLQFSKAVLNVNQTTVTLHTGSASGTTVALSSITAGHDNTFVFSPNANLNEKTTYYIVLSSGITDTSGNPLTPTNFYFTTGDFTTPTVNIVSPSNNATGTSTNPSIQLQFSEAVNNVNQNTVTLRSGSTSGFAVAIGGITAGANNTYTFSPATALNDQTTYYVVLSSGISDISGNSLTPINFHFTTGVFTPPTVSIISPNNNATGISTSPSIQLQFSKTVINVNSTTVTLRASSISGTTVAISSITAGANNTYTFSPSAGLNQKVIYYVVLGSGITDTSGNALVPTNFHFTTGDFTSPTVNIISPSNNATGVSTSPSIQLQFSEAVNNVNSSNITLRQNSISGTIITISGVTPGPSNTYTFSPNITLMDLSTYYVVIGSGITDTSGNALTPTNFYFTTGDFTAPTANMISPTNNATGVSTNPTIQLQFSKAVTNVDSSTVKLYQDQDLKIEVAIGKITPGSNNTYTFSPNAALNGQNTYYVVLNSGITDLSGNALATTQFSFTTAGGSSLVCWGDDTYGQISKIPELKLVNPTNVSVGNFFICAQDQSGVHCWGDNSSSQIDVPALENPSSLSAGGLGACAIDKSGVVCWGYNKLSVPSLNEPTIVSAGYDYACTLDKDGVQCFGGDNKYGQTTVPSKLSNITAVSAGLDSTCVLGKSGVQCWGDNSHGQTTVPSLENPTTISTGGFGSCSIDKSGVVCWGDTKLGTPSLKNPMIVSAGGDYACALDTEGVHCFGGANTYGQTTVPGELKNASSVSAGTANTCAISSN